MINPQHFNKCRGNLAVDKNNPVIATGFEPVTACLEGRCSIQLSYATLL